ncbi:MAG: endolytic transglycosylase MltG [Bacteroidetes bacterium]|nr:endolytic transglycosylase MltG [Bacteroidota bacterium]
MKKKIFAPLVLLIVALAAFAAWKLLGPATNFPEEKYYLYIKTGMSYDEELKLLEDDHVLSGISFFKWLASKMHYPENIKAGKYEIRKGMNLIAILRMLKNGRQVPVNWVITKFRTKKDIASYVGKHFECDSSSFIQFLENNDSLKQYGLDSNTVITAVFPNTYTYFWNTTPSRIFKKLYAAHTAFWTEERKAAAQQHNLNPTTAYVLASIIEEETNMQDDKGKIASVYLNRISKGMKLAADPTIKFALGNFELKRIYEKYLSVESPYNTYKYAGLPPGPICTPTVATIDAVINAPKTNYLYFVAKPDFSGYSNFAETFEQHLKYAREYQKALDVEMAKRAANGN